MLSEKSTAGTIWDVVTNTSSMKYNNASRTANGVPSSIYILTDSEKGSNRWHCFSICEVKYPVSITDDKCANEKIPHERFHWHTCPWVSAIRCDTQAWAPIDLKPCKREWADDVCRALQACEIKPASLEVPSTTTWLLFGSVLLADHRTQQVTEAISDSPCGI